MKRFVKGCVVDSPAHPVLEIDSPSRLILYWIRLNVSPETTLLTTPAISCIKNSDRIVQNNKIIRSCSLFFAPLSLREQVRGHVKGPIRAWGY